MTLARAAVRGVVRHLDTLHMVLQILGKVRVALSPKEPEWAHVALYVSARGITTGPVPSPAGLLEVEVDFARPRGRRAHVGGRGGRRRRCATVRSPSSGASSSRRCARSGVNTELSDDAPGGRRPDPVPRRHDAPHVRRAEAAARFWQVLTAIEPVFEDVPRRVPGQGVARPVLLGERRPRGHAILRSAVHAPSGPGMLERETYDYEQMSVGWWPGNASFPDPAFYAYAYPKPEGIEAGGARRRRARRGTRTSASSSCSTSDVRTAASPAAALREFLDAAYDACASPRRVGIPRLVGRASRRRL